MRTYGSVKLLVTEDADQRKTLLDMMQQFDDDDATTSAEAQASYMTLVAGASDIAFNFGGVTRAASVLIIAWDAVTVKFDGTGNAAIPVRPVEAKASGTVLSELQRFDQPGVVLWRGRVASIHLGNPSGVDTAQVYVAITGDAAV